MIAGRPSGPGARSTRAYISGVPAARAACATARAATAASAAAIATAGETASSSPAKRGLLRTAWVSSPSIQTSARSP